MRALQNIRVLELAESVAGEYCGKLLGDFGARIIKVEAPGKGSPTRYQSPFSQTGAKPENSGLFAYLNTNKQSAAIDLDSTEGRETLDKLLQHVDVLIDDHEPQWLANSGLDAPAIREKYPELIHCSITPFGLNPPAGRVHATDLTIFHSSGWGYHTPSAAEADRPPLKGAGRFLPSYESGLEAAMCIMAALCDKQVSGSGRSLNNGRRLNSGRCIDVSMQEVLASRVDYVLAQMVAGDLPVGNDRTAFDLGGPAGIFACRDGYAYIWMSAPAHWDALRELLDDTDWMDEFPEHWLERECTPERVSICRHHIATWLKTQDKHEAAAAAQKLGLTLVAVQNGKDLQASEQYLHRGFFSEVDHPVLGSALYPTVPYKMSETPANIVTPAPLLGEHTEEVLDALHKISNEEARINNNAEAPGFNESNTGATLRGGPLQGVRVVELTKVWAGPCVGKQLAYLGAEVIRVESEGSLDVTRTFGVRDINNAPGFQAVNPEKLSVQINMKSEKGIALILDLLKTADIVVENLRPGAIKRLGLGYETVKAANPRIIYVSMGMYGNTGPLSYQTGYAPCFAALGGITALTGYEGESPAGMNVRYADSTFGTAATFAALVAFYHQRNTGTGQFIDVSAVETMSSMIGDTLMDFSLNGRIHQCDGNRHAEMAPHGIYPCQNGEWLCIAVASDEQWRSFAQLMGCTELGEGKRFASRAARKANEEELNQLIVDWSSMQVALDAVANLQAEGIAAVKSQSSLDMIADPHLWERGFYREVTDCTGQSKSTLGPAWQMDRAAEICRAAPQLGEHNRYVSGEILGISIEEQEQLESSGVIK